MTDEGSPSIRHVYVSRVRTAESDLAGIPPDLPSLHEQFLDLLGDFRRLLDDIDRGLLQLLTA